MADATPRTRPVAGWRVLKPRAWRPGDRIAVIAPASPFRVEEFEAGVAELRRLGFEPIHDDRVFARRRYVAGEPLLRAAMLREALVDPTVAGVVCVRGGYGSVQVLPLLDADEVTGARKAIVGYSDVTSLLTFVTGCCGLVAFHGPMLVGRLGRGAAGYDAASFLRALTRAQPVGEIGAGTLTVVRAGDVSGPLFGGTLTQLLASLATPYAFDPPRGHILFLEDVNERPYRLDRMLLQLRLSGILAKAAGVVFGEMAGCDEPGGAPTARDVIADLTADFAGPVVVGLPSGHTTGPALTLPLGVRARLLAMGAPGQPLASAHLYVEEPAVEP